MPTQAKWAADEGKRGAKVTTIKHASSAAADAAMRVSYRGMQTSGVRIADEIDTSYQSDIWGLIAATSFIPQVGRSRNVTQRRAACLPGGSRYTHEPLTSLLQEVLLLEELSERVQRHSSSPCRSVTKRSRAGRRRTAMVGCQDPRSFD